MELDVQRSTEGEGQPPRAGRLCGIEALRGIAAVAVVLSHAAHHVDRAYGAPTLERIFRPGHAGVDLFFTLSGFIILFVHRGDLGRPSRLKHYLGRRLTRVLPLYWVALALTILMDLMGGHPAPHASAVLTSASLLPVASEPLLRIAWTLKCEMLFYAVFAVSIVSRKTGEAVFGAWLGWIFVAAFLHVGEAGPFTLHTIFGIEFFIGLAAAELLHRSRIPAPGFLAMAGAGAFVAGLVLEATGRMGGFGVVARFAYGIASALMIVGVAECERSGALAVARSLRVLGGASYSIYLFQFVFLGALWTALRGTGLADRLAPLALFLLLATAAVAGGVLVARFVEKPLLRLMRERRGGPPQPVGRARPGLT